MKNYNLYFKRYFLIFLLAIFAGGIVLNSCKKDDDDDEVIPTSPELPPQEAFVMDYSSFQNNKKEKAIQNWGVAVTKISVWNLVLTVNLAVPIASYAAALSQQPVYQGEMTWLWSYDFKVGLIEYTAKLYGKLQDGEIEWKMYISKGNLFSDFLWYEGKSKLDKTGGNWKFYHKYSDPIQYLDIEWSRDITASTATIKYTQTSGENSGSYITYGKTLDLDYNAFYEILNKANNNNVKIKWNTLTKNGRIQDPGYFNNEEWHCWDKNLQDINCDPAK